MNCPACGSALSNRKAGSIVVDVCEGGCGGAWFDNFELGKVDAEGVQAIRSISRDLALHVDQESRRTCPRCQDQAMLRRYFSRLKRTQIDECPNCAGIWLDAGEFDAIRTELGEGSSRQLAATLNPALNRIVEGIRNRSKM